MMASQSIVDISSLLEPISEDSPVGEDIREDTSPTSPYYSIKDARNSARAAERNSLFDGGSNEADDNWRKILELAPEILKTQSKDLEVASWYTEALIRRFGFQGLRDGFIVIRQMLEQYWDDMYPLPDEDGIETRVLPLTGLNGEGAEGVLIAPIRNAALTENQHPGPFSFWQYQQALDIQKIMDDEVRAEKAAKIGYNLEDVENAVAKCSEEFFVSLRDDIRTCLDEYRQISRLMDEYCGTQQAPPTSNIINILEDTLGAINHIGKYKLPLESLNEDASTDPTDGASRSQAGSATVASQIKNREEAFRQLMDISEFFRKTEPHSPISYVLSKAVKWGDMTLSDLMRELIPDSSSRDHYGSLTGVKTTDE